MAGFTASDLYGGPPPVQPVSTPGPSTTPGNKTIRTAARPTGFSNPTFLLIVLLGIAFALIHFSVTGSIKVSA